MEVPVVVVKQRASASSGSLKMFGSLSLFRCCPLSFDFSYDMTPKPQKSGISFFGANHNGTLIWISMKGSIPGIIGEDVVMSLLYFLP